MKAVTLPRDTEMQSHCLQGGTSLKGHPSFSAFLENSWSLGWQQFLCE